MLFIELPYDCQYEIILSLDILSYFNMTCVLRLTKTINYNDLKYIYNSTWKKNDHYIGDTTYNPLFKSSANGLLRHGFGIYTQYISKYKEVMTIGYWNNNDIKYYKKITKNTKLNTEQAIVCQRQQLSQNTEIKYKGGWYNHMRNSIGTYDIIDQLGNIRHRDYGNWQDNKKHGCFNEIIYNPNNNHNTYTHTWLNNIDDIYIRYYKYDELLPIEFRLNNKIVKIIDKTGDNVIEFNLNNQYTLYTACVNINIIMTYYMYKRLKRPPLCIITSACSKEKICNCELCNYIIKHKKQFISKNNINL